MSHASKIRSRLLVVALATCANFASAQSVAKFCSGDGSGTPCPCGPGAPGRGCPNTGSPAGAELTWTGTPSVGSSTLVLHGSSMPNGSVVYIQGTAMMAGGAGVLFGDGLRCVGGIVHRLAYTTNVGGASSFAFTPAVVASLGLVSGSFRTYQAWYRDAGAHCPPFGFNLTNGVAVTWR